jgi:hypothetical protein
MRRYVALGLVVLFAYAVLWGATWLAGDRSFAVFGTAGGVAFSSYPGVFLGGLPPHPGDSSDLPELVAAAIGVIGLVALAVRSIRARNRA